MIVEQYRPTMLRPDIQRKNPVMFVVEIGALLTRQEEANREWQDGLSFAGTNGMAHAVICFARDRDWNS